MVLLLFYLIAAPASFEESIVPVTPFECLLVQNGERPVSLNDLLPYAVRRGYRKIRLQSGVWEVNQPVLLTQLSFSISILPDLEGDPATVKATGARAFLLQNVSSVTIEGLIIQGGIELDETENITFRKLIFRGAGIYYRGRRCNQPNECTSFNRNQVIEDCEFQNTKVGILAERLEYSAIRRNRFIGIRANHCEEIAGIVLDGSSEDIDRPLEYGHNKGNSVLENSFEQEFSTGIRISYSYGNRLRDNHFHRAFRAIEMQEGARYNQATGNYITYLSQMPVTSTCPSPCGIYVAPGSVSNLFVNNFFEQNFELQFLERHRNRLAVIDESGGRNVFRSDYLSVQQNR